MQYPRLTDHQQRRAQRCPHYHAYPNIPNSGNYYNDDLNRNVGEQIRDRLAVVRATNGLGQSARDIDDLELRAALRLVAQRDSYIPLAS